MTGRTLDRNRCSRSCGRSDSATELIVRRGLPRTDRDGWKTTCRYDVTLRPPMA